MTYVSLSSVSTHQDLCKLLLSKGETIGTMFLIIMVLEIVFVCIVLLKSVPLVLWELGNLSHFRLIMNS